MSKGSGIHKQKPFVLLEMLKKISKSIHKVNLFSTSILKFYYKSILNNNNTKTNRYNSKINYFQDIWNTEEQDKKIDQDHYKRQSPHVSTPI